jgi:hypothetical protein
MKTVIVRVVVSLAAGALAARAQTVSFGSRYQVELSTAAI